MVDKKPPNFDSLEPEKQKAIDSQINKMIQKNTDLLITME